MKYNVGGINLNIDFTNGEDDKILVCYTWLTTTITVKEAIIKMMKQEFDLEYFTDYTINATSMRVNSDRDRNGSVMIWLRNSEDYVMIKLKAQ